jgi:hypothetical protein
MKAATRAKTGDSAALDVMLGPSDGMTGFKRVDVAVQPLLGSGLRVEIEVPPHLSASIGNLLAALGVKGQR